MSIGLFPIAEPAVAQAVKQLPAPNQAPPNRRSTAQRDFAAVPEPR